jgi:DNA polymerase III epsilon subunit family exonuclease
VSAVSALQNKGFLAFDVETPDASNARICQIGCVEQTMTSSGIDTRDYGYLVNPECEFSPWNVRVHGITEDDVAQEPDFAHIWREKLAVPFGSHILVVHNARFDMNVLDKTLTSYGVDHGPMRFVDTLQVARTCYPELPNHKLDTVSSYLGVSLEHHHDAADDAWACYGILIESIARFGMGVVKVKTYMPKAA